MATRFRLPSAGSPAVTPSVQGSYTHTGSQAVRPMPDTVTGDSSALSTVLVSPDAADHLVAGDTLHAVFVSAPMEAGIAFVTTDTVKWAVMAQATTNANNLSVQIAVFVVSQDGATLRATLLTEVKDPEAFGQNLRGKSAQHTLTGGYTTVAGDRLVVEFSVHGTPTAAAGVNGHNASLRWGSDGTGDLVETNDSTTTTTNPWFESSRTITFSSGSNLVDYTGSGGYIAGGAGPHLVGLVPPVAGGLNVGGAADVIAETIDTFTYTGTGGALHAGAAAVTFGAVIEPAGGMQAGGSAPLVQGAVPGTSGGLSIGGVGGVQFQIDEEVGAPLLTLTRAG